VDVYLVRHAVAERRSSTRWPDDTIRPLTANGAKRFARAARGLRRIVPTVDVVLASPYARAWQTAQILHDEIEWPAPEPCAALGAPPPADAALETLRAQKTSGAVAMVGHDPHLTALAALLLAGPGATVQLELEKGGAICLACPGKPAPGKALLCWSIGPKILTALDLRPG
jgi:phosphohistidine phosphatase